MDSAHRHLFRAILQLSWFPAVPILAAAVQRMYFEAHAGLLFLFAIGFGTSLVALWFLATGTSGSPSVTGVGTLACLFLMTIGLAASSVDRQVDPANASGLLLGCALAGLLLVAFPARHDAGGRAGVLRGAWRDPQAGLVLLVGATCALAGAWGLVLSHSGS